MDADIEGEGGGDLGWIGKEEERKNEMDRWKLRSKLEKRREEIEKQENSRAGHVCLVFNPLASTRQQIVTPSTFSTGKVSKWQPFFLRHCCSASTRHVKCQHFPPNQYIFQHQTMSCRVYKFWCFYQFFILSKTKTNKFDLCSSPDPYIIPWIWIHIRKVLDSLSKYQNKKPNRDNCCKKSGAGISLLVNGPPLCFI